MKPNRGAMSWSDKLPIHRVKPARAMLLKSLCMIGLGEWGLGVGGAKEGG